MMIIEVDFDNDVDINLDSKGPIQSGCFVHLHLICTSWTLCMMSMLALVIVRPLQFARHALNHNHFLLTHMFT